MMVEVFAGEVLANLDFLKLLEIGLLVVEVFLAFLTSVIVLFESFKEFELGFVFDAIGKTAG